LVDERGNVVGIVSAKLRAKAALVTSAPSRITFTLASDIESLRAGSPPPSTGSLTTVVLPSGDIQVTFRQARTLNDNVYGTCRNRSNCQPHPQSVK
jgi:hypothetical protein